MTALAVAGVGPACSSSGDSFADLYSGDAASRADSAGADASTDASAPAESLVKEKPAPACHDLAQRASLVSTTPEPAAAPRPTPLTTLEPGLYVVVSSIEHGVSEGADRPVQTTAYVTANRFYASVESPTQPRSAATFEWSLAKGVLTRKVLCATHPRPEQIFENRVDASPNGFTIYIPTYTIGTSAVYSWIANRFERVE